MGLPNEHPGSRDMTIWRQALHFISSDSYTLPFMDQLGRWTAEPHLAYRWFYSPVHHHIFFCHDTRWDQYEPILARATHSFKCMAILPLQAIEAMELQYASTHWEGEHLLFDGSTACAIQSLPVPHDMAEYISWDPTNWPLFDSYFPLDPSLITLALMSGMGILVCDGSYKPYTSRELGTASWIFECSITAACCHGVCQTSGLENDINAYQSELQGIHAGLIGMLAFCTFHNISGGSFWLGCDNEVSIFQSLKRHLNIPIQTKHADLIWAIRITI